MGSLRTFVALGLLVATAVACGPGGEAPVLGQVSDQVVAVGEELVIVLTAESGGSDVTYSFDADVPDIQERASLSERPDGAGVFRWRPIAGDVGEWFFDFSATSSGGTDTITIKIDVRSAVGAGSAPIFREPLGTGTTLDLETDDCVELDVVVEDQDSASVVIAQEEPVIPGAVLTSTGGLTATWRWCPTEAQIAEDDRYTLQLSADDGTNPKSNKHYLIVLRKPPKPNCPGDPPVVTHTPMDESVLVGLTISAQVSDDLGLKREPLLYYSTSAPGTPPDLSQMTQVTMVLVSGTMQSGQWAADVPNPVAAMPAGSMADVHYVIVANDNDDANGDCDHLTQAPATGSYTMTVTNPGGSGGGALCQPCTADVQCGQSGDSCVWVGTGGDSFCLKACSSSADCPTDYTCSSSDVESVDGVFSRQCVPLSNDCSDPGGTTCTDDGYEDNDSLSQAAANPPLAAGSYTATSCPATSSSDDEDWYRIEIASDTEVTLTLSGGSASDLDLALVDSSGSTIDSSISTTSNESVSACVGAGTYYIRVYAWSAAENPYTLDIDLVATSCSAVCQDDGNEPDDSAGEATYLSFNDIYPGPWVSETNAICAYDDDWFEVLLVDGDTLVVDLTFEQTTSSEDLDLHFIDGSGVDLTPCEESNPGTCTVASGQSATSNEHAEYVVNDPSCTISAQCTYYVKVHGWAGAENLYDISFQLVLP